MSHRSIASATAVAVCAMLGAGCIPPPLTAPSPIAIHSARASSDVIQISTRDLSAAGYQIVVSDVAGGTVSATRKGSPHNIGADLTCRWPKESMASTMGETALTITVTAHQSTGGTDVQIATNATTSYSKTMGPMRSLSDSETDCVSSGAAEKRISAAIGA